MNAVSLRGRVTNMSISVVLVAVFVLPLLWMLSTSLKTDLDAIRDPGLFPAHPTFENFRMLFDPRGSYPVLQWMFNSMVVSVGGAALTVILSTLSGYAFARMRFPGRQLLLGLLLSTFLLPGIIFLVPQYVLAYDLGLYNTLLGLILPGLAGAFGVVFMRQFFTTFPIELEEAAAIDGAGAFKTLVRIVLPLTGPPVATLATISFLGYWNDYLWPLVMCRGAGCTLSAGLANFQGEHNANYGVMMASAVVGAVPILVVFLLAQRWIVRSIAFTGTRG